MAVAPTHPLHYTSQIVLAFFDNKGPIYTNFVPRETTFNNNNIAGALGKFINIFNKERLKMAVG